MLVSGRVNAPKNGWVFRVREIPCQFLVQIWRPDHQDLASLVVETSGISRLPGQVESGNKKPQDLE